MAYANSFAMKEQGFEMRSRVRINMALTDVGKKHRIMLQDAPVSNAELNRDCVRYFFLRFFVELSIPWEFCVKFVYVE